MTPDANQQPRPEVAPELLRWMHHTMRLIRRVEERIGDAVEAQEIRTPTHLCIGQEAVAVGVCAALRHDDYAFGNHRSHGHYLAKGGDLYGLVAEIYCRADGCSRGRGGSMHLFAGEVGLLGTVPMVAATIPIAVGAGLTAQMRGTDQVSVAFFGDGATEEGPFHEALNFAALKRLPVLFVCENNLYSSHLPLADRRTTSELYRLAEVYDIPGIRVDGNDVLAVYSASAQAVARARRGLGPTFLECMTFRWRGHVGPRDDLDVGIRDAVELAGWIARCPIEALERHLLASDLATESELQDIRERVREQVEHALERARGAPAPDPARVGDHVYMPEPVS